MHVGSALRRLALTRLVMLESVRRDRRGEREGLGLARLGVLARFMRSEWKERYFLCP